MALEQVEVGHIYEMEDGRKLKIVHEWDAVPDYRRVRFEVIEGPQNGFLDCPKREFQAKATREVKSTDS